METREIEPMLTSVSTLAWTIDQWLKEHLGRPYTIILTVGLVAAISANIQGIEAKIEHGGGFIGVALNVVVDAILLVNQLAQLHEYRQERRAKREARKQSKAARKTERDAL
jgi:hypothetical protein